MNVKWLLLCMLLSGAEIAMSADSEKRVAGMKLEKGEDHELQAAFARLATSGKFVEAIDAYNQLSDAVRTGAVFRLAYFDLLIESGKRAKALSIGIELVEEFPHNGRVLCALGVMAIRSGDLNEGEKLLRCAIDADPWYAQSYYELARVSTDREEITSLCSRGLLMSKGNKELAASLTQLLDSSGPDRGKR